jgi:hypothetical protein
VWVLPLHNINRQSCLRTRGIMLGPIKKPLLGVRFQLPRLSIPVTDRNVRTAIDRYEYFRLP